MKQQLLRIDPQQRTLLALGAAATGLSVLLAAPAALAQPVEINSGVYRFDFNVNAGPATASPAGPGPWLTAVIEPLQPILGDGSSSQGVFIRLTGNLSEGEYIESVGFNLDPLFENTPVTFECVSSPSACQGTSFTQDANDVDFPNDVKGLDFAIDLPTSNAVGRFEMDDIAVFKLSATGLIPKSFTFASEEPGVIGAVYSAAKVQGIKTDPGSTTIVDPRAVPGPLPLLGAFVALGFSRRLRRRLAVAQAKG